VTGQDTLYTLGAARVLYDVDDEGCAVYLLTVGRVGAGRG